VYIATARPGDDAEMQARIARHRATRPDTWTTVEEAVHVADAVVRARPEHAIVIVDCVTVWLSNLLWEYRALTSSDAERAVIGMVDALAATAYGRDVIAVSNEVGGGIVPDHPVARLFRDIQGFANQRLAHSAGRVVLLVAGLPLILKDCPVGTRV
jgi:adenosylcobinamide kinase/adenosylcobinamide-phosphate guanylyltransferase